MSTRYYALMDCNNFFVSCERVFQPILQNVPVVVLSNNDGCIVARSSEAKALDIPMAAPYFKWQNYLQKHGVKVCSSNYALYAEMSHRVMHMLKQFSPSVEIYSIDEAFLDLSHIAPDQLQAYAASIRATILQWTGLPVSIGIGKTKTLAKVANYYAKKHPECKGVMQLDENTSQVLADMPAGEVWGIGRKTAAKLERIGIRTTAQFMAARPELIRKLFSINGLHLQQELSGVSVFDMGEWPELPKSMVVSRSFRTPQTSLESLSAAISGFVEKAGGRLRAQGIAASQLTVFVGTNRFERESYYGGSQLHVFPVATNDTLKLIEAALAALERIYRPHEQYKRAGIALGDMVGDQSVNPTLFSEEDTAQSQKLMKALDAINMGKKQVFIASSGKSSMAGSERKMVSPSYLSRWEEVLEVQAK